MIRIRAEQLDILREDARDALAERLATRGEELWPERSPVRGARERRLEARRLATTARERGLVSEEDVTLFYDLSMDLGPGFEQGPTGAWARRILRERLSPHARALALREKVLGIPEWDPRGERGRRALTGRVTRVVGKGPPRRADALRRRLELLDDLARSLCEKTPETPAPEGGAAPPELLRRVRTVRVAVRSERAMHLELEQIAARGKEKTDAARGEKDPARREGLEREVTALSSRFARLRRRLLEELAEAAPRPGSADAEDPCVARVETDAVSARAAARDEAERRLRAARELTAPSGTADPGDAVVVAIDLSRAPGDLLDLLRRGGTRVVACRHSVVDHRGDLAGGKPRGWPPGTSWRDLAAVFDAARNEVVVATRGHAPKRAGQVPRAGDGHASAGLAVHAAAHAVDHRCGRPSSSSEFRVARAADRAALPAPCRQEGSSGLEEAWAESAARFAADEGGMSKALPALHAYWTRKGASERPEGLEGAGLGGSGSRTTRVWRRKALGVAWLGEDGAVVLDLRASDGGGILGDARLVVGRDDPRHGAVLAHLGGLAPGETKPVPPWSGGS